MCTLIVFKKFMQFSVFPCSTYLTYQYISSIAETKKDYITVLHQMNLISCLPGFQQPFYFWGHQRWTTAALPFSSSCHPCRSSGEDHGSAHVTNAVCPPSRSVSQTKTHQPNEWQLPSSPGQFGWRPRVGIKHTRKEM